MRIIPKNIFFIISGNCSVSCATLHFKGAKTFQGFSEGQPNLGTASGRQMFCTEWCLNCGHVLNAHYLQLETIRTMTSNSNQPQSDPSHHSTLTREKRAHSFVILVSGARHRKATYNAGLKTTQKKQGGQRQQADLKITRITTRQTT